MNGRLEVVCGPVLSGKTTELYRRVRRAKVARITTLVLCHESAQAQGHPEAIEPVLYVQGTTDDLDVQSAALEGVQLVAVDDAHRFSLYALTRYALNWVSEGRTVIAAGLDRDYTNGVFTVLGHLMAHADQVDKLLAVCVVCGSDAGCTRALADGGLEPRCRSCWKRAQ